MIQIHDNTEYERLDTLLRQVFPVAPGVPYELALDYARKNYIHFCRKSRCLRQTQVQNIQRGVVDYYFDPIPGFAVIQVDDITDRRFTVNGTEGVFLTDVPSRDEDGAVEMKLVLLPVSGTNVIPSELEREFGPGIVEGVKSDIFRIAGKAWSSVQLANDCRREFNRAILNAKNEADVGRKTTGSLLRPVRWV